MATITIRNLDEKVKRRLQVRAALNGRSMEAEARAALSGLVRNAPIKTDRQDEDYAGEGLGTAIHNLFAPLGGADLQIPLRRKSHRPIPTFDE
ncbi:MAG: FitA-like ribbon-helix-helix domain-containing protein [Terracidiphilus sp.]